MAEVLVDARGGSALRHVETEEFAYCTVPYLRAYRVEHGCLSVRPSPGRSASASYTLVADDQIVKRAKQNQVSASGETRVNIQ